LKFLVDTDQWTIQASDAPDISQHSWFDECGFNLLSEWWLKASWQRRYSYQFQWLGRPIIQLPADIVMMQDLIFRLRPTVIIETGIAHGGSAIFHASVLSLLHREATRKPCVIGIDIEIRHANRLALDGHPLRPFLHLIEGSSIDCSVVDQVSTHLSSTDKLMVVLDSNHTREHVMAELEQYAPMVSEGSAIVVMDTIMPALADLPAATPAWKADNPGAAIESFLKTTIGKNFVVDDRYDAIRLTHSPRGVLLRQPVERQTNA
jgi:cephalosporin hydroxylase